METNLIVLTRTPLRSPKDKYARKYAVRLKKSVLARQFVRLHATTLRWLRALNGAAQLRLPKGEPKEKSKEYGAARPLMGPDISLLDCEGLYGERRSAWLACQKLNTEGNTAGQPYLIYALKNLINHLLKYSLSAYGNPHWALMLLSPTTLAWQESLSRLESCSLLKCKWKVLLNCVWLKT